MAKVTTVPVTINKLVIELNEKEAAVLFAILSCTNGRIAEDIYYRLRELGFSGILPINIGDLDIHSIEDNLDKYFLVPDSLKANNV